MTHRVLIDGMSPQSHCGDEEDGSLRVWKPSKKPLGEIY